MAASEENTRNMNIHELHAERTIVSAEVSEVTIKVFESVGCYAKYLIPLM